MQPVPIRLGALVMYNHPRPRWWEAILLLLVASFILQAVVQAFVSMLAAMAPYLVGLIILLTIGGVGWIVYQRKRSW